MCIKASAFDVRLNRCNLKDHRQFDRYMDQKNDPRNIAKRTAITAHNDANQYYDKYLYSFHLRQVVDVHHRFKHLIPETAWPMIEDGLWWHDGPEDARKTFNDVAFLVNNKPKGEPISKYAESVAEISYRLTNDKGKNRKERAGPKYYNGICVGEMLGLYTLYGKLCDRIANVERSIRNFQFSGDLGMAKKYKKENPEFKEQLTSGFVDDSKYKEMWEHLDNLFKTI